MAQASTLVHLVYIHGFQGKDTTFKSFPTNLHEFLAARVPSRFSVKSSVYPTYKSVKPITFATRTFLEWLSTQPPGHVILIGHSMGGLLAADAATDPSSLNGSRPQHIMGMIAFDTPYLGMHPHVVISGIASLFQRQNRESEGNTQDAMGPEQKPTSDMKELNDQAQVTIVGRGDLNSADAGSANQDPSQQHLPGPPTVPQKPRNTLSASTSNLISRLSERASPYIERALEHPSVRWAQKHHDAPIDAGKTWVVEHYQFGACMFDPKGLKKRYEDLLEWKGFWVNYWTRTKASPQADVNVNEHGNAENAPASVDSPSLESTVESTAHDPSSSSAMNMQDSALSSSISPRTKAESKAAQKKATKEGRKRGAEEKKRSQSRHFVVLPNIISHGPTGGENWESVEIAGVDDEVAAHCGLFIPEQNLEYDALVERVGKRVLEWCDKAR
ncbi:hypothetical protein BV22DRAFT_1030835 [Leucogyrophana mollusca]|uniref:Uncharacterized protein n=1 Tax=Leucogyrophana mollusca TaxID=85980 RepID=A0ACB8BTH0_9AGAM|nr:hypothetical protein BV22DRAFT_1030835 [Leucogyrophana mollusca]